MSWQIHDLLLNPSLQILKSNWQLEQKSPKIQIFITDTAPPQSTKKHEI